jgi:hypothetical protein
MLKFIKYVFMSCVIAVGVFVAFIVQGQERWKAEEARDRIIEEEKRSSSTHNLYIRYMDGDPQARYYIIGLIRASRSMMEVYDDYCPEPVKTVLTQDHMVEKVMDQMTYLNLEAPGDIIIPRIMLDLNSCAHHRWPELIN